MKRRRDIKAGNWFFTICFILFWLGVLYLLRDDSKGVIVAKSCTFGYTYQIMTGGEVKTFNIPNKYFLEIRDEKGNVNSYEVDSAAYRRYNTNEEIEMKKIR